MTALPANLNFGKLGLTQVCKICHIYPMNDQGAQLDRQLQLRISTEELAELDELCALYRRKSGENISRTSLIRNAIKEYVAKYKCVI